MLSVIEIDGINGEVLVKEIVVSPEVFFKLAESINPETQDFFLSEENKVEIPLNDFDDATCYGDVTFFADEINSALTEGAELLWVSREML